MHDIGKEEIEAVRQVIENHETGKTHQGNLQLLKPGAARTTMNRISSLFAITALVYMVSSVAGAETPSRPRISLDGTWHFRMDPKNVGETDKWFESGVDFPDRIRVPGCWEAQGFGKEKVKPQVRHVYMGKAWYRRSVKVPANWKQKRVWLKIGGTHRFSDVWVNGTRIGGHDGFVSAYKFDITKSVQPGKEAVIAVRIDNVGRAGNNMIGCFNYFHSWGGFSRSVSLEATAPNYIDDVFVRPDIDRAQATFQVTVRGPAASRSRLSLAIEGDGAGFSHRFTSAIAKNLSDKDAVYKLAVPIPNPRLWSPKSPALYVATVSIRDGAAVIDRVRVRFGMRKVECKDGRILLNNRPVFLRGYGDDNVNSLTGFPPTDSKLLLERFKRAKAFGFNHVRYHSWCPPPEFFDAADEVGMLLLPELQVAYQEFRDQNLEILRKEWTRLIVQYRSHPSFFALSEGNEFRDVQGGSIPEFVTDLYIKAKELAPELTVLDTTGFGFSVGALAKRKTDILTGWYGSHIARAPQSFAPSRNLPTIAHEIGNFNALEDCREIPRHTGPYVPQDKIEMKKQIESMGLEKHYDTWVECSRRLQHDARKWLLEEARYRPWLDGFHYWLINDWHGLGSHSGSDGKANSIGIFNAFWEPKSNDDPSEYRKFNGDTVLISRHAQHSLVGGRTYKVPVVVSHYGDRPIEHASVVLQLVSGDGSSLAKGQLQDVSAPCYEVSRLGTITISPPKVDKPWMGKLRIILKANGQTVENDWRIRVFPPPQPLPGKATARLVGYGLDNLKKAFPALGISAEYAGKVCVSEGISQAPGSVKYLLEGGRLLCFASEEPFSLTKTAFFPSWWSQRNNLGTAISTHPILAGFPHDGYCDRGFQRLVEMSAKLDLRAIDGEAEPIIWSIPDRAGFLFEFSVGKGRLVLCSFNLPKAIADGDPLARDIFVRIVKHLSRDELPEACRVDPDTIRRKLLGTIIKLPDLKTILPPGPKLQGFKSFTKPGEQSTWKSYREDNATVHVCRQTSKENIVEWETDPASDPLPKDSVTFIFAGSAGFVSQPETAGFAFIVNGKPVLDFDVSLRPDMWTSKDKKVKLVYIVRRKTEEDSFGLFYVVINKDLLTPGQPCRLGVQSKGTGSRRWFGLTPYRDLVTGSQ